MSSLLGARQYTGNSCPVFIRTSVAVATSTQRLGSTALRRELGFARRADALPLILWLFFSSLIRSKSVLKHREMVHCLCCSTVRDP